MAQFISYSSDHAPLFGEDCAPIARQRIAEMERRGWRCVGRDRNGTTLMAGPLAALTANPDWDEDDDAENAVAADPRSPDPGLVEFEGLMREAIARAAVNDARQMAAQSGTSTVKCGRVTRRAPRWKLSGWRLSGWLRTRTDMPGAAQSNTGRQPGLSTRSTPIG